MSSMLKSGTLNGIGMQLKSEDVQCRTNFFPALHSESKVLKSLGFRDNKDHNQPNKNIKV